MSRAQSPHTRHDAEQAAVMAFLADPATHAGAAVQRIDTHISAVFLAGERAYKLKKAVRLPFLDFTALSTRAALCAAEVTLNRRTAPALYLGARPVLRRPDGTLALGDAAQTPAPAPAPGTEVLDWVVEMRRFPDDTRLDRVAAAGGGLPRPLIAALAAGLAAFHRAAAPAPDHGGAAAMRAIVESNRAAFAPFLGRVFDPAQVAASLDGALAALDRHASLIDARRAAGKVRRCHGDLHLGNIALIDGVPLPFDAIEFSDTFACIDVLYDLAFLLMDLAHAGYRREAGQLLNAYLEESAGERDGLALLPVLLALRAQIRAHVGAAVAAHQADPAPAESDARRYLAESLAYLHPSPPLLVAVGGLSGSGKSRCARELATRLGAPPGAVVVRSDVVRKHLAGIAPLDRLPSEAYTPEASAQVYAAVNDACAEALAAGRPVVADAVFARPEERAAIAAVARAAGVPFAGLWLEASPEIAEQRILGRRNNASDATPAVLRSQMDYDLGAITWSRIDSSGAKRQTDAAALAAVAAQVPLPAAAGSPFPSVSEEFPSMTSCPCGSGRTLDACCGPLLAGQAPAPTAEALMRSRYTAFATGAVDYILDTVHPEHRAGMDRAHISEWSTGSQWLGLEVLSTEAGGADDAEGWVEFVARFSLQGKAYAHHETGYFRKDDGGRWTYVDGNTGPRTQRRAAPKVGRNDPCPCGSGKKYKKCCGAAA